MAPDQQAARPQAAALLIELTGVEIGEFEIRPVMQPRPLGSAARRQAAPIGRLQLLAISSAAPPIGRFRLQDPNQ
jgi:hypothetical protein